MSIDRIQHSLDSLGYHTFLGGIYLTVARKANDEDSRLIDLGDIFCRVWIATEGNQFKVTIFGPQIPDDRFFDSESQVIAFIKKQFPL
jgi:hypothetical protein